jgi:desumoylating isopeptidase 1
MRAGAVPQAPQFVPSAVPPSTSPKNSTNLTSKSRPSSSVSTANPASLVQRAVRLASKTETKKIHDPLGEKRNRVQEEITKEYQAIMATGTLCASEAAALATRRVMERHAQIDVSMQR